MSLKRILAVLSTLALVMLFFTNCSGPLRKKIIPEKKFVNLLADIHLADGIAVDQISNTSSTFTLDSASFYGSVLNKYHVTRTQFDNTLAFYASHPVDCQRMYNKVIARLKLMEEELKKQEEDQQEQEKVQKKEKQQQQQQ
jgi:hypothetical protein